MKNVHLLDIQTALGLSSEGLTEFLCSKAVNGGVSAVNAWKARHGVQRLPALSLINQEGLRKAHQEPAGGAKIKVGSFLASLVAVGGDKTTHDISRSTSKYSNGYHMKSAIFIIYTETMKSRSATFETHIRY